MAKNTSSPDSSKNAKGTTGTAAKSKAASTEKAKTTGAKSTAVKAAAPNGDIPRLQQRYRKEVIQSLMKEFGYENINQVPKLQKIVINFGLGEATANPNIVKTSQQELTVIAGQRPVVTRAKKAIANFKLREGLPIGCMVTLRRDRMWEFLDRLVNVAMPRIRDFKGVSAKAFDGRGNYSLGMREQIVFPEIDYDKVEKVKGFNVTIATSAKTDEEGRALLRHMGMPFRN